MKKEIVIDPYTGEKFEKSRSNQKFAIPQNGKDYNNDKAKKLRHSIAHIQKPLSKNRKILDKILGNSNSVIVSQDFLLGAEYDFNFYTATDKERTIFLIYDFEMSLYDAKLKIIRRNPNG